MTKKKTATATTTTKAMARVGPVQEENVVPIQNRASSLMLHGAQWKVLLEQCQTVYKSGIVPSGFKTAEQLAAVALWGLEIGIPPMRAWQGAYMAKGKLGMKADLARALILERAPGATIELMTYTETKVVWRMARPGGKPKDFEFTMEQAQKADLTTYWDKDAQERKANQNYKKWPRQMLAARAFTMGANLLFPDILQGASIAFELEDGEVVVETVSDPSKNDEVTVVQQEEPPTTETGAPPENAPPPGAAEPVTWDVKRGSTRAELPKEAPELNTIREYMVQLANLQLQAAGMEKSIGNTHKRYEDLKAEMYKRHVGDEPGHRPTPDEAVSYLVELEDRIKELGATPKGA